MKLTKKLERSTKTLFYKLDLINEVIKEGREGGRRILRICTEHRTIDRELKDK